jgi:hypothetical protein
MLRLTSTGMSPWYRYLFNINEFIFARKEKGRQLRQLTLISAV